ncbi:MAG TPA: hypothetical protein VGG74_32810 [Kofleriaceae bacterium]|jgi:hypothetical protein
MLVRFASLAAVAVVVVSLACNSGSISAQQACADLAHATCSARDSCSGNFLNARDYGTEAICEARTGSSCVAGLAVTDTAATPESREDCAKAFGSGVETCLDYFEDDPAPACEAPTGAGATGDSCAVPAQCASTYCAVADTEVCGTCQPLPMAGATCTVTTDCGRDLGCAIATGATSGVCAAWVATGGACLTGVEPCVPELACMGDDPTSSAHGTCVATVGSVGSACDSSRKDAPPCNGDLGLACIPSGAGTTIGTCQMVTLAGVGETCGSLGGPPITSIADCAAGATCVKGSAADRTGTCVAPAADGAPCDSALGPPCLDPAKCVPSTAGGTAGTCTLPYVAACP